jgi:hypothetical protein
MREKVAMFIGTLYVVGTASYVAVFIFMIPYYAAFSYLQATVVSLAVIEILKPLLQAMVLTLVLQSRYANSFAAHFPQISDFSHRHVLEDAEFTHAHWAELTRVLTSPSETKESPAKSEETVGISGDQVPSLLLPRDEETGRASVDTPKDLDLKDFEHSDPIVSIMFEGADNRPASIPEGQRRSKPFRCGGDFFSCAVCVVDPENDKAEIDSSAKAPPPPPPPRPSKFREIPPPSPPKPFRVSDVKWRA